MAKRWLSAIVLALVMVQTAVALAETGDVSSVAQGISDLTAERSMNVAAPIIRSVQAEGGTYSLTIDEHDIGDMHVSTSWVKIAGTEAGKVVTTRSGKRLMRVLVEANPNHEPRDATIRIGSNAINLCQMAKPCPISLPGGTRYSVDAGTTEITVDVKTTEGCGWTAEVDETSSGLIAAVFQDPEKGTLRVDLTPQGKSHVKTGRVIITASDGRKVHLQVVRGKKRHMLGASRRKEAMDDTVYVKVPFSAGSKKVKVVLEAEPSETISWSASVESIDEGWLSLVKDSGDIKTNRKGRAAINLSLQVTANPSGYAREGEIIVEGFTINVIQEGQPCVIKGTRVEIDESPITGALPAIGAEARLLINVPEDCEVKVNFPVGFEWLSGDLMEEIMDERTGDIIGYESTYVDEVRMYDEDDYENSVYVGQEFRFAVESNEHAARAVKLTVRAGSLIEKITRDGDYEEYFKVASARKVTVSQSAVPGWAPCEITDMKISDIWGRPLRQKVIPAVGEDLSILVAVPQHCHLIAEAPLSAFWLSGFDYEVDDIGDAIFYFLEASDHYDDEGSYQGKVLAFNVDTNSGKKRRTTVRLKTGEYDERTETYVAVARKNLPIIQSRSTGEEE